MGQPSAKVENPFIDLLSMLDIRRGYPETGGEEALPRTYSDIMTIKDMKHSAKRFEITKEILEAYLDADPDNSEMLIGLAVVNFAQGDTEKAESILGRVLEYEPVNDDARRLLAVMGRGKGDE